MDWEDIKTFGEVVRGGTVRSAAKALGVHHSTVSRRIENLEKTMGARLFDRRPEGYSPTQAGEELIQAAKGFSDKLIDVERHISGSDNELAGRLTVTMADPIATWVIGPRLSEFTEKYPKLELEVIVTFDMLDVARMEADVAIRMNNNPPETLVGKRLFKYCTSIYASDDYLEKHDLINEPEKAAWLGWGGTERFPEWTQETEFSRVPIWGHYASPSIHTAAARAGLGLAMLPCIQADRTAGLMRVTKDKPKPQRDIWILTHNDLRRTARVRAFMEFAEKAIRDKKSWLIGDLSAEGHQAG